MSLMSSSSNRGIMYTASYAWLDPVLKTTGSFRMPPNKRSEDCGSNGNNDDNDDDGYDGDGRRKEWNTVFDY